jgi:outer membrane beta-barrel protein
METGLQRLFLTATTAVAIGTFSGSVLAEDEKSRSVLDRIITPDLERRQITEAELDSENFEMGAYVGFMNIEDFGTSEVYGIKAAYHISEDFFAEANYATATLDETSYERLSGGTQLLTDDQKDFSYYNLSIGYNFLPGEGFLSKNRSFNTSIYVVAGVGNTNFVDDDRFTYNVGAGIRIYPTDWLAVHLGMRAHTFTHDVLGEDQTVINLEGILGLTGYF